MTKNVSRRTLGIGLIGSGFMGKAHALAFRTVGGVFPLAAEPRLEILADISADKAARAAYELGFARFTAQWERLVLDPAVDIVAITTPNRQHAPMALAAIAAGKHVYCEKPLATSLEDARAMTEAAERAGVVTQVGFNYLRNPMVHTAKEIIASGEIGDIIGFSGQYIAGFMGTPEGSWSWRFQPEEAGGALADIGSHLISMSRYLLGEVASVCAGLDTVYPTRTSSDGQSHRVGIDDQAAILARFQDHPFTATLFTSWVATGREMGLSFDVTGSKGALRFTQERLNELELFKSGQAANRRGFTRLTASPAYPPYGAFTPGAGHQLGFNDLKVIEVRNLIDAVCGVAPAETPFRDALRTAMVMEAVRDSSRTRQWMDVPAQ
ncbi:oxidoreductase domain protein [Gluconacetobacter diazotrophicus PA1 5]|uniref:Gfo/Idh/MocA family oxidoreductase n=2 Tax=Gluconacetobacter diazotrophicus TaxID=33996 RepID=A0A7W4I621_GLUDI|nr:Gfo/Idh/MocA family oxidoreductase [Gluconacetobacter diazotrophicus]ACI52158.1 oxidoreductase domain protein [Gluconacetobacter diazotrophicus PA1 5]MBB2156920.1 Gfo/Idh/MocA family oxidoreductase [Gluconacetobacter diazotrophicus]TWB02515.1 putative dehydrogenase [Gluconacetobacter diazotrophicus]CAP54296.1 putative oxidoreductase protein [Gluconacetobacter diazotrophicus PA1 5]